MPSFIKSPGQISKIRQSSKILAATLKILEKKAHPGVNLLELEDLARSHIEKHGGKAAFLGYRPEGASYKYPAALCTSVNDVVVHGVPHDYELKDGDILKLDLGVDWQGGISDAAITVAVGNVSGEDEELINLTRSALEAGINAVKPQNTVGDIGHAIEKIVKAGGGYLADGLTGHGVGEQVHEEPAIYNFGSPGEGVVLVPGMVIAIEPMVSMTTSQVEQLDDDSFATLDGSKSAHFEHTILVTQNGKEVLTL